MWSVGESGDSLGNIVGHYAKHGHEFGAKNLKDYYNKANEFIDSGKGYRMPTTNDRVEIWDPINRVLAVTDASGAQIRTFHKVNQQDTINRLNTRLNLLQ